MVNSGIGPVWHADARASGPHRSPVAFLFYGVPEAASPRRPAPCGLVWTARVLRRRRYRLASGLAATDTEVQRELAARIVGQDQWVLDSAYGVWRDLVVPRAELIVGLDYPRWLSLLRLIRRSARRVITREEVCNGNRETLGGLFAPDSIIGWHFSVHSSRGTAGHARTREHSRQRGGPDLRRPPRTRGVASAGSNGRPASHPVRQAADRRSRARRQRPASPCRTRRRPSSRPCGTADGGTADGVVVTRRRPSLKLRTLLLAEKAAQQVAEAALFFRVSSCLSCGASSCCCPGRSMSISSPGRGASPDGCPCGDCWGWRSGAVP